ncbi:MAG TPA: hypothetical protein VEC60_12435 [Reyranella sp.]|nr:hypothetical protein [Reyranella sp.]
MSEYQYYEFHAIDRPLSDADQRALRKLSTRARISATSFKNSYDWGDFGGDPAELMRRWFDLHLYYADFGSRRLMMRFPKRLVRPGVLERFLRNVHCATIEEHGDNLILDIWQEELETDDYEDDGKGWLANLAPLRADILGGDRRVLYLLWLTAVETGDVDPSEPEPLPGLGPMTAALEAFVDFFQLKGDLVEAAAERPFATVDMNSDGARRMVSGLPEREKTEWLTRLVGDPSTAAEFRSLIRTRLEAASDGTAAPRRTAGELRARAQAIWDARCREVAAKEAARLKREAAEAERARLTRLETLRQKGEAVWHRVETEICRRNPGGYKAAHELLLDLKALAELDGTSPDFEKRLRSIHDRHARKGQFIERLKDLG